MNRTKLIAATVAAMFCLLAQAGTPPLDIKGLAPGQTAASLSARPGWTCEPVSQTQSTLCSSRTETLAGVKTKAIFTTIWKGRSIDVHALFGAADFLDVRAALVSKYGPPATDPNDHTNFQWEQGSRVLRLRLKSAVGDMTSSLSLTDGQSDTLHEQARKEKAQASQGDL